MGRYSAVPAINPWQFEEIVGRLRMSAVYRNHPFRLGGLGLSGAANRGREKQLARPANVKHNRDIKPE